MIEAIREAGNLPLFVLSCIGAALGLALILFGLAVKIYCRYF